MLLFEINRNSNQICQFTTGCGDCTEERKILFADMTLDDLLTEMSKTKQKPPKRK